MLCTEYLVTGVTGHLGNSIVRNLVNQDCSVRGLALPNDKVAKLLPKEMQLYTGDITNKESLRPFFTVDGKKRVVLIHSAGIVTISSKFDRTVYNVNVGGTKNILKMCYEYNVDKLVYVSSVHAIPELPSGQVITEIKDFNPDKVVGLYAKTKAEATALVLEAASNGLDASVVHPSGLIGPYDYGKGHTTQLLIDYYRGRLIAGVRGGYDFVDVRDVADGVITCCRKGNAGECYILSNRYFSLQELFELFHMMTGKKRIKAMIPMWFARINAPLSELYYSLLRQPPLYTSYSLFTLSSNSLFSHEKASNEFEYTVRPIENTIKDTVEWLISKNRM